MTNKITSPHDKAFRSALTNKEVAKQFFEQHLPDRVKQVIDIDSLTLCSETYIDQDLSLCASDIVYSVMFNHQPGYLYVLAEHQKKPDKWMPFRIVKYVIAIMEKHIKQNPNTQRLPLVVPLVFYQGKTPYPYTTDIKDLVDAPRHLIDVLLFQPFKLIEAGQLSDEELYQRQLAGLVQLVLKHVEDKDVLDWLPQGMNLVIQADQQGASHLLLTLINYTLEIADAEQHETVLQLLTNNLSKEVKEKVMTIAERLRQEGLRQGFEKGKAEGKTEGKTEGEALVLKRLLQLKFGPIPADYQAKINLADSDTLLVWSERVLTATTLHDIFLSHN